MTHEARLGNTGFASSCQTLPLMMLRSSPLSFSFLVVLWGTCSLASVGGQTLDEDYPVVGRLQGLMAEAAAPEVQYRFTILSQEIY